VKTPSDARVAVQLVSTGGVFGAERVLLELAGYLRDQGWDSRVLAIEGDGAAPLVEQAHASGIAAEAFVPAGRLALRPMIARLNEVLARFPRAVLHSHGYKPDILLALTRAYRRHPCVATCHNWVSQSAKMRLLEFMDRRALRHFGGVVAVSTGVETKLLRAGVTPQRVHRIANGISTPLAAPHARENLRREFGIPETAPLLLQIGRMDGPKRNDLLLQAVGLLPDRPRVHVLLVGDGPCRGALAALARTLGLQEFVHFAGYRSDIGSILAGCDVLVISSDIEAMPVVMLEAMAVRCPVVATAVGDIPQVLADGTDAWIVPPGDRHKLREALAEVIAQPGRARDRALRAQQTFLRNYSRDAMGAAYLGVYEELCGRR
jgi:glycosyltransferase involved in cell wall biosynthesis